MIRRPFLAVFSLLLLTPEARAMTGNDYLNKMTAQERTAYVAGALEMLAYSDKALGQCAVDWYLKGDGPTELAAVITKNPELPIPGILTILAKRHCK